MPTYDITPVPKPRMTRSDKWKQRPAVIRYRSFCDEVRLKRVKFDNGDHITFVLPMPESWPKRHQIEMLGTPHQQTPDSDNLLKAVQDAIYKSDSHIWDCRITKIWGREGAIIVEPICK